MRAEYDKLMSRNTSSNVTPGRVSESRRVPPPSPAFEKPSELTSGADNDDEPVSGVSGDEPRDDVPAGFKRRFRKCSENAKRKFAPPSVSSQMIPGLAKAHSIARQRDREVARGAMSMPAGAHLLQRRCCR